MNRIPSLVATLALVCALPAQDEKPKPKKPSWPKLSSKDASRAKLMLRKIGSEDEEVATEAESALVEIGPGAAKMMFRKLATKNGDSDVNEAIARVLDQVLAKDHAPLLAPMLGHKSVTVRRYASQRIARFHVKELIAPLRKATKDEDELVVFHAALGLTGIGDFEKFDVVFDTCNEDWRTHATVVAEVLEPMRGKVGLDALRPRLDRRKDQQTQITALRLLRTLCPKSHAGLAASFLEAEDHAIKKEAINALRAIVDGDPPLENLSVFQAIEHAKKWKARV